LGKLYKIFENMPNFTGFSALDQYALLRPRGEVDYYIASPSIWKCTMLDYLLNSLRRRSRRPMTSEVMSGVLCWRDA
jgi:hypothetical protein